MVSMMLITTSIHISVIISINISTIIVTAFKLILLIHILIRTEPGNNIQLPKRAEWEICVLTGRYTLVFEVVSHGLKLVLTFFS